MVRARCSLLACEAGPILVVFQWGLYMCDGHSIYVMAQNTRKISHRAPACSRCIPIGNKWENKMKGDIGMVQSTKNEGTRGHFIDKHDAIPTVAYPGGGGVLWVLQQAPCATTSTYKH